MSRPVTVVTPENVEITYEAAGIASRFIAFVIDLIIQIVLIIAANLTLRSITGSMRSAGLSAASIISAAGLVLDFLILFAYATLFEMLWGGRTPGKRLLGLRVIRDGGYPVNLLASALRNILRFIDFGVIPLANMPLVLFGLPGLVTIFLSANYKRIGDYAAGTLVIVEAGASPLGKRGATVVSDEADFYLPQLRNLDRLTLEDYQIIRRFTSRRNELSPPVQAALAERLALPLMQKLDLSLADGPPVGYPDFLEALERSYAEKCGLL